MLLVNLTGAPLPPEDLAAYGRGLLPLARRRGGGGGGKLQPGTVATTDFPPGGRLLNTGVPTLVLVLPPRDGVDSRWRKMYERCAGLESVGAGLKGRVFRGLSPAQWDEAGRELPRTFWEPSRSLLGTF